MVRYINNNIYLINGNELYKYWKSLNYSIEYSLLQGCFAIAKDLQEEADEIYTLLDSNNYFTNRR